jgi:hypothetical protein
MLRSTTGALATGFLLAGCCENGVFAQPVTHRIKASIPKDCFNITFINAPRRFGRPNHDPSRLAKLIIG